jgi:hypothetical protein
MFEPQHSTPELGVNAHACHHPAAMAVAPESDGTRMGTLLYCSMGDWLDMELPSWPEPSEPQQATCPLPSEINAQEKLLPIASADTKERF